MKTGGRDWSQSTTLTDQGVSRIPGKVKARGPSELMHCSSLNWMVDSSAKLAWILNTMNEPPKNEDRSVASGRAHGGWSALIASLVFSAATFEMLVLYGIVHWQIMFQPDLSSPRPPEAVFTVLAHLARLRLVFAVLAVIWAIWSFRGCPRGAALFALAVSLFAILSVGIMM